MQGSVLLLLVSIFSTVHSSCYVSSAKWDKGPPTVTQPSKTDPSKVLVDWSAIIKNSRCVDKYILWVWKDGQEKGQGKKFLIPDKNTQNKIVDVEQCVFYNFRIELEEDDSGKTDLRGSETARYTSATLPNFNSDQVLRSFSVGYAQDPVSKQFDLTKASVRFHTSLVTFANCLKYVEVSGKQKSGAAGLASAQKSAPAPPVKFPSTDDVAPRFGVSWEPYGAGRNPGEMGTQPTRGWRWSGDGGFNPGGGWSGGGGYNPGGGGTGGGGYNPGGGGTGGGGYNPGGGGTGGGGYNPGGGGSGGGGYNPGGGGTGGGGYNPGGGGTGGGGYNPGGGGSGGGGYNPGGGGTGGGGYNPGGGGSGGGYNPGTTIRPSVTTTSWGYNPGGRPPTDRPGGGWSYPTPHIPDYVPNFSTTSRPDFSSQSGYKPSFFGSRSAFSKQFLRMTTAPDPKIAGPVKKASPFLTDLVEILVPVQPCQEYSFDVKFVNPQNQEIGKISGLELVNLADLEDYIPPPTTSVVLVEFLGGGKQRVTTQPTGPVPESCLVDYLEAVDAYANRLETVANEQARNNTAVRRLQALEQQKVEVTQADILDKHSCVCASPRLELRMNPTGVMGSFYSAPIFGVYLYEGMWEGKPYYKQDLKGVSTGEFRPLARSSGPKRRKRFIGRVDGATTTTARPPWNYGVGGGGWSTIPYSYTTPAGRYSPTSTPSPVHRPGVTTTIIPIQRQTSAPGPAPTLAPVLPRYLYWEPGTKQWLVSPQAGAKEVGAELSSAVNSKLLCPADAAQVWKTKSAASRSGSHWADDSSIQLQCAPSY